MGEEKGLTLGVTEGVTEGVQDGVPQGVDCADVASLSSLKSPVGIFNFCKAKEKQIPTLEKTGLKHIKPRESVRWDNRYVCKVNESNCQGNLYPMQHWYVHAHLKSNYWQ